MKSTKIQERINKVQADIEKRISTTQRLETQLAKLEAKGAENWELRVKKEDIESSNKKLAELKERLAKYQFQFEKAQEAENTVSAHTCNAIIEFLEIWKAQSIQWYVKRFQQYKESMDDLNKRHVIGIERDKVARHFISDPIIDRMRYIYNEDERSKYLEEEMEHEKQMKLQSLILRITAVVGTITDASDLHIGMNGEINGIIVGDKCSAYLETISAGGYNIQRFHFRTLIHKKED